MKLRQAISIFLEKTATDNLPTTAETYKYQLIQFAGYIGDRELQSLTEADINGFKQYLKTCRKNNGRPYAEGNINYKVLVVKIFLNHYWIRGLVAFNPMMIKLGRYVANPHRTLKPEEFEKILEQYRNDEFFNVQKKLCFRLLWETGVRVSELCNLDISDLRLSEKMAIIRTEKSYTVDPIFWSAETHELLLKFLGVRLTLNQRPELFITAENGSRRTRLTPRTMQRWCKEAGELAGIPSFSPHCFRHGKAHNMKSKGADIADIATGLRHRSWRSAEKYLKFDLDEKRKIAVKYL